MGLLRGAKRAGLPPFIARMGSTYRLNRVAEELISYIYPLI